MIDVENVCRLNNYDTDALIRVLELNEDRLYAWLIEGSVTVVGKDLGRSIEYVKALREVIKAEQSDYVDSFQAQLPIRGKTQSGSGLSTRRTYGILPVIDHYRHLSAMKILRLVLIPSMPSAVHAIFNWAP